MAKKQVHQLGALVVVFALLLISPLRADKITEETNHRLVRFFECLGAKTGWYFALEESDDDAKAKALADKLESSKGATVSGGDWNQERISKLVESLDIPNYRIDPNTKCITLSDIIPPMSLSDLQPTIRSICFVQIGDANLLAAQTPGNYDVNKAMLILDAKATDYLTSLENATDIDYHLVTLSGKESALSDPQAKVLAGPMVCDFINKLCLSQDHSHFLFMAYVDPNPNKRGKVNIYIGK